MTDDGARLILGVDGGGSGCRVALARADGAVLARASGGPANVHADPEGAAREVEAAVRRATALAGLERIDGAAAHLGLAGVMRPDDGDGVAAAIGLRDAVVTDDLETSLAGALGTRDGVLAAIGTGSCLAARRDGALRRFGGWGPALGDEASGAWLGRSLLRRCLLVHDGLEIESPLTAAVRARFGGGPAAIVAFARTARPADYAALAPLVVEAAGAGDAAGCALMRRGATYLAACLDAVAPRDREVVCLTGGLGPHYAPHLPAGHRARLAAPAGTALDGALALARARLPVHPSRAPASEDR